MMRYVFKVYLLLFILTQILPLREAATALFLYATHPGMSESVSVNYLYNYPSIYTHNWFHANHVMHGAMHLTHEDFKFISS